MTKRRTSARGSCRPSPSNVLANLPPDQLREFCSWLVKDNETYASVQAKLKKRFGVTISENGISAFWRRYVAPEIGRRDEFIRGIVREQMQLRLAGSGDAAAPGGATS